MKHILILLLAGQATGQSRQGDTILIQNPGYLVVENIVTGKKVMIEGQLFQIVLDPIGGIFNDPPTFKDIVPKIVYNPSSRLNELDSANLSRKKLLKSK